MKVSLFGKIAFGRVGEPELTDDGSSASRPSLDFAGTKVKALLQRVEAKDYLDVAALLDAGAAHRAHPRRGARALRARVQPADRAEDAGVLRGRGSGEPAGEVKRTLIAHATRDVEVQALAKLSERVDAMM